MVDLEGLVLLILSNSFIWNVQICKIQSIVLSSVFFLHISFWCMSLWYYCGICIIASKLHFFLFKLELIAPMQSDILKWQKCIIKYIIWCFIWFCSTKTFINKVSFIIIMFPKKVLRGAQDKIVSRQTTLKGTGHFFWNFVCW